MIRKPKVNFLVIGAQKSGTSSLFRYLGANLMIGQPTRKELHYFDLFHFKGKSWYHSHFDFNKASVYGECTPFYLMHPEAPERAHHYNPDLKLIAILRNPAERAWSHYQMNVAAGRETMSFTDALKEEEQRLRLKPDPHDANGNFLHFSYQKRGRYAEQLTHWLKYFPKTQLLVISYHDFFLNPWLEIQKVYSFLGVAPLYGTSLFHENTGSVQEAVPADAMNILNDYFRAPNKELASKFNIRF